MIFAAENEAQLHLKLSKLETNYPCLVDIQEGELRTVKQNARYWAAIVAATQNHLGRQTGVQYSKNAIHDMFKTERYGKKIETINGKIYERCARSSKFSVIQFARFSEWAEAYAIDKLGVDPVEIDGLAEYEGWR